MSIVGSLSNTEISMLFSIERLERLSDVYDVEGKSLVLIHENLNELSGAIFASLSIFEIHLRNSVSTQLEIMFCQEWYNMGVFSQRGINQVTRQRQNTLKGKVTEAKNRAHLNAFSKLSGAERRRLRANETGTKRQKDRKASQQVTISSGDVISHFYFSFWRTLFSIKYEPQLWNYGLKKLFPKNISRGTVSNHLEVIYKVRNRIAHQEFIHPNLCKNYLTSIRFLTKNIRLKGTLRTQKMYQFQEPYIRHINLELSRLNHLLGTLQATT